MTSSALIHNLSFQLILFGARGGGRRRSSSVDAGEFLFYLVIGVVLIAAVCLAIYASTRVMNHWRYHSHASLFLGLCRLHQLDQGAKRFLRQVARHHNLQHPARVFTEPKWLAPTSLSGTLRRQEKRAAALYERLFAQG